MSNNLSKKFLDRMFKRVSCLVWDLSTGKLGIQEPSGIFTLEVTPGTPATATEAGTQDTFGINVNPIENFGFPIPAFATQVKQEDIKNGDLVVGDKGILGWVIGKTDASLKLLDKSGMTKNYTPPKVAIMGGNGTLVVQSLNNLAGGEGFGALQGGLLPMLMMGGDNFDLESIVPLMLMTQTQGNGGGNTAMASMLPMLMMMGKKSNKVGGSAIEDMLPMLMMSGGLGGGAAGGMNPMMMAMMMDRGGNDNGAPALEQIAAPVAVTRRTAPALQPIAPRW